MEPEQLNEILKEWDACVVGFEACPGCGRQDTVKERFLMLDVPWTVEGVEYKRTGTFVCCEDIDERQMLKNMIYYLLELKHEVL
jgi:hypothetical protein